MSRAAPLILLALLLSGCNGGTVDDVRNEVVRLVDTLGKDGGFVLCSSHHLQPDTPVENILAMYDVALRYRS